MFGKQGRYGLSNRHISHVRYASFKRGRQRLFFLLALAVGMVVYYKARLKNSTTSVEENKHVDSLNIALGQRENLNVPNKINSVRLSRIVTADQPTDLEPVKISGYEFKWRLAPSWNCKKSSPFLIILIASHLSNQETRDVIRNSWCRRKMFPEGRSVACVFLLGDSEEEELLNQVTKESQTMKDILKGNFPDNFRNSSRKLLMGLSWIERECPDVKFLMKTEDDVIVNSKVAINKLSNIQGAKNTFMGKCWSDEPNRNPKSRFYVSVDAYPQVDYPEYCSGAGYIMSGEIARRLLRASQTQTILPFDEVYTGVLLEKVGVAPKNVPGFLLSRFDESAPCRSVTSTVAIHVHGLDMKHVWSLLKTCNGGVR